MDQILYTSNSAVSDEYISDRCDLVERVTLQTTGISREQFHRMVAANMVNLPGRRGQPERQTIQAATTLMACALKLKMLHEGTVSSDPIGWAMCCWVSLLSS
jgi:hypothetical protein